MIPQYQPSFNREELAKELSNFILSDTFLTEFKKTQELEKKISEFLSVKYCSCVPSGTLALVIALLAHGVKPGDKVIIPNITMMSTQSAVELIGASPVFIDVNPNNLCLDIYEVKNYIENNTVKAVIYVTLNGRSHGIGELQEFYNFCLGHKIGLIEDNAQAFGSQRNDNHFISAPKNGIGCFSLSFHKLLQSGQGGFIVTDNDYFGLQIKKLKNVGRINGGDDIHDDFGINAKYTDIQAVIALNQLTDIKKRIEHKRRIFRLYYENLKDIGDKVQFLNTNISQTCPWFVDIYCENRDGLSEFLKMNEIGTRKIYPPLTSQSINNPYKLAYNLSNSYNFSNKGLWLPSSLNLTKDEIELICKKIKEFYRLDSTNV